jgi:hypothetical protein
MSTVLDWIGDLWTLLARIFTVPPADGRWRGAAFVRFEGADGLGHVGWGFDVSATTVNLGAVENPSGQTTSPARDDGYWDSFMQNPIPTMASKGYNYLKYVNLAKARPFSAYRVAKWIGTIDYKALGRNCLDDTYDVLRAYGVPELPPPADTLLPNVWFDLFAATSASVQGFDWAKITLTGLRHQIAVALRTTLPPLEPTWRRAGHPDEINLQQQIAGIKSAESLDGTLARRGDAANARRAF